MFVGVFIFFCMLLKSKPIDAEWKRTHNAPHTHCSRRRQPYRKEKESEKRAEIESNRQVDKPRQSLFPSHFSFLFSLCKTKKKGIFCILIPLFQSSIKLCCLLFFLLFITFFVHSLLTFFY